MLRLAKPADTGRIVDLLLDLHGRTRYAELEVDRVYTRSLVAQAIQRNMGTNDGGCLVAVEVIDSRVEAFIIGALSRVYMISSASSLSAKDLFLVASDKATKTAAFALLGAYCKWAGDNPKVYEIELTHTDVTPESERMGVLYERMGFEPFGRAFRRSNPSFTKSVKAKELA